MEIVLSQSIKQDEADRLIKMIHHLTWFYRMGLREMAQITYPEYNTSERFGDAIEAFDV